MSEQQQLISVVMPAYNAQNSLQKAIESVLAQTYTKIELIIVDDGSTDDTYYVAQQYADKDTRIRLFKNEQNCGVSYTRRRGVSLAAGDLIAFLDSDDVWVSNKLQEQVDVIHTDSADLVYTGSAFMTDKEEKIDWVMHIPKTVTYRQLLRQNVISNSSVLIKKTVYEQYAVMDDTIHEDFACWLLCLRDGKVAVGIDLPLLVYRISGKSKSGNKVKAAKMNWRTYRCVGLSVIESLFYEIAYMFNGFRKYTKLWTAIK